MGDEVTYIFARTCCMFMCTRPIFVYRMNRFADWYPLCIECWQQVEDVAGDEGDFYREEWV
jgi:hypothetical protein